MATSGDRKGRRTNEFAGDIRHGVVRRIHVASGGAADRLAATATSVAVAGHDHPGSATGRINAVRTTHSLCGGHRAPTVAYYEQPVGSHIQG